MPSQAVWEAFFDANEVLRAMGLGAQCGDVLEFGCGYGTFTLPAARLVAGNVHALDLDTGMLAAAANRARAAGISNIVTHERDFVAHGSGLFDQSVDYAMLFNILHLEEPVPLLREAYRNLADSGSLAIIHWIFDAETPRGPPLEIRPRPEQCRAWAEEAGFHVVAPEISLPPYHHGLLLQRLPGPGGRADY